jgi:hypothetical protein
VDKFYTKKLLKKEERIIIKLIKRMQLLAAVLANNLIQITQIQVL